MPIRLLSVGGNLTLTRLMSFEFAAASAHRQRIDLGAVLLAAKTGSGARDHAQREKPCAIAPVTKLRAWAVAASAGNGSGGEAGQ